MGLAQAVDPALRVLHPAGPELAEARARIFSFFNTNPITSGLVLGVIIRQEEERAASGRTDENRRRVVDNLCGCLASLGDALFWQSWLPLCCLSAVWAHLALGYWWTPLLLPFLFGLPALPVRFFGLFLGYYQGDNTLNFLFRIDFQRLIRGIRRVVAFMVGASTAILVATHTTLSGTADLGRLWLTLAGVVICVFLLKALFKKIKRLDYWYPVVFVILACVLLLVLNLD